MKTKTRILFITYFLVCSTLFSITGYGQAKQGESRENKTTDYYVAAYIWPSCHHDERFGDMLWPERTGEWEVIKKGTPRFDGHYQPKQPLWGYELDNDPKVMEKWIDAATDHHVNLFIFDWYWFDNGPFLESTLNDGFLKAKNNDKMQFYLMWANHDVKRNYWNVHQFQKDESVLWHGAVGRPEFNNVVHRVIDKYFKKDNYFKIDGAPVFYVFDLNNFVKGLGGLEKTRIALEYFRDEVRQAGFPDLHFQVRAGGDMEPSILHASLSEGKGINEIVAFLGINSVTKYGWGQKEDYLELGKESMEKRERLDQELNVPYFPNVSIAYDDTPRFPASGKKDVVHYHDTPQTFGAFLQKAKQYCDDHPDQPKLITLFSWNEWVEGSYLLPDMKNGFKYLETVKEVMTGNYDKYTK